MLAEGTASTTEKFDSFASKNSRQQRISIKTHYQLENHCDKSAAYGDDKL
jgi:hypothetical protein